MAAMMKVRIAVLVGSNGKVAAQVADDIDWGLMADCIMDWPEKGSGMKPSDPELSARYIIEADVPRPEATNTIQALSVQQVASPPA